MLMLLFGITGCSGKTSEGEYLLGVELMRAGKSGDAIVSFKNALEKNQNNLDARYQLAKAYMSEKKYALAEKEFQKVRLLNPNQPDIYLDLALLHAGRGKIEKARLLLEEIIGKDPTNIKAINLLAEVQAMSGRKAEATAPYKKLGEMGEK